MSDREKQVVIAASTGIDGVPLVVLGMSKAGFEYSKIGNDCHQFDLTKVGIPVRLIMFTRETHDECRKHVENKLFANGHVVADVTRTDLKL